MRERSHTTPRRRGPKLPPPPDNYVERFDTATESPYYTIDNTEDIYGTTLLPSQRCYVDPWDLENYDYVRKKLNATPSPSSPSGYYETTSSPSPAGPPVATKYYYMPQSPPPPVPAAAQEEMAYAPQRRMAATMPRNRRRSHWDCELECCVPPPRRRDYEVVRQVPTGGGLYDVGRSGGTKYEDYMMHMTNELQAEEDPYTGYGGFSSSSSTERHSSIEDDCIPSTPMMLQHTPGFGAVTRRRGVVLPKPAPKLEFPAPPPLSPTYDYCNPYATLPYSYCSVSDCYECLSQVQHGTSLIYAAPSIYNTSTSIYGGAASTLGRRPSSSLYGGIYSNKFGLSKKGLLQIDYSCSWNDLDRVMARNY